MTRDPQAILGSLLDAARKAGADAADALYVEGVSSSVSYRLGKLEDVERSESYDLGLRVFVGQKIAFVSSTDFSAEALAGLPGRAVAMARLAPEDKFAGLAPKDRLATTLPQLDLEDGTEPSAEALIERARTVEGAAMAVAGVTNSEGGGASFSRSAVALATSSGFYGRYAGTNHSIGVAVLAGEGTGMERDYDHASARHAGDLRNPQDIGRTAGEKAVKRLNPRSMKSQSVPVVFHPDEAAGLLGHFAGAISGSSIARGVSFLKDRMGADVFASGINIIDDPHRVRGLRSKPFDGEGVANARRALIENGRLTSWLLDCASARQLGLETTGHAARGTGGPPSPASTNLYLEAGRLSVKDLLADISQGFYVTELMGMGVNGVTGDYSRGAAGFWIENGEIAFPVSEVTIAGNLKDMFARLVPANDLEFRHGVNAPTVRIEGMTLAGHAPAGTNKVPEPRHAPQNKNMLDDLKLLEDTVHQAGHIARKFYGGDYKQWSKEGGSPVTEADLAVNKYLYDHLTTARPNYGWLSEENTDDPARLSRREVFIIDPIDGTIAFLKNRPHFTICAAIVVEGHPCCGVVYNPVINELYSARIEGGAHRNGVPIHVAARTRLEGCFMLGDRSQLTKSPWPAMDVQNRNSVAYRLVLVADGSADASVSLTAKRDWDLAAADVILHEAGGLLTDASGAPLLYNRPVTTQSSLVAANPRLHTEIVTLLNGRTA